MEKIGEKTIDELGRIILPLELRKKCNWEEQDNLSIYYVDKNTVVLKLVD